MIIYTTELQSTTTLPLIMFMFFPTTPLDKYIITDRCGNIQTINETKIIMLPSNIIIDQHGL